MGTGTILELVGMALLAAVLGLTLSLFTTMGLVSCSEDGAIIPRLTPEFHREGLDYPIEEEEVQNIPNPLKRARYDYWKGFGSDGFAGLYDFVKRGPGRRREGGARNLRYFRDPMPAVKKSRYNYWKGFGSDSYAGLY